jgi:hypothetical protein
MVSTTNPENTTHEEPLGFESILIIAGFLLRSVRRHPKAAAIGASATFLCAVLALLTMAPVFRSEGRILTHMAYFIPALASPTRSVPWQSQHATTGAIEVIRSRENYVKVINEAHLAERWASTRTRTGKILDSVRTLVLGPLEGEQLTDALVSILEKATLPYIDNDVISISIDWNDAETARLLAEASMKVFLERRQNSDISEIEDTVKILERNLESSRPILAAAENNLRQVLASRGQLRRAPAPRPVIPVAGANPAVVAGLAEKRARLGKLHAEFESRIARAQEKVDRLRESIGPSHPDMISAVRDLEDASRPSEEMNQLQAEAMRLEIEMSHSGAAADPLPPDINIDVGGGTRVDPAVEQAMADYRRAREAYDDFKRRLSDTRIEMQTTKAAFSYRYIITQPPLKPAKAIKPRPPMVLGAGFVASLVMGLLIAVLVDLRTKKVVESWMVERIAHVPLLGEIDEP